MSETIGTPEACPGPDLLLLLAHGADTLDADEGDDPAEVTRVTAHVAGCARCAGRAKALATSLAAPPPPFDPLELLPAIKARLAEAAVPDAASAAESDALAGAVKLRCTFCRGGLAKSTGVYCARCLAPHHGDCFGEHGRCAAPGCDGREVVSARAVVAPTSSAAERGRRRPRGLFVLAAAALAGGGGLAALRQAREVTSTATPAPTAAPAPTATTGDLLGAARTQTYDVADLVTVQASRPDEAEADAEREVRRRLEVQQITLNLDETPLSEAVAFLRDITGLNVHLAPGLDGALPVSLRLRNVALGAAVDALCAQVGATAEVRDEALTFSSATGGGSTARWSAEWLPPPAAGDPDAGRRSPDALLALVGAELGPDAKVEVAQRTLVVTGGPAIQAATVALLDRLRLRSLPPELTGAWFRPAPTPAGDPGLDQAREHLALLESRKVTLNFPATPLPEVFAFLQDIGLPPPRLDGRDTGTPVELRVKDVAARSAMLLAAKSSGWSLDVDRRGLAFRAPQRPPLELRLREAAQRALAEQPSGEPEPLLTLSSSGTLAEVLALIQDQSGANVVVERGVDLLARAALEVKEVPLGQALDRLLAPLGLGIRRAGAVLRIVPRDAATETAERVERLAAALATPLSAGLDGGSAADLASRVASATGAEVHLGAGARGSRARLRVPAGVTVRQALELATHQAGLRWATTWFEEGELLVAIDGESAPGPLEAALHALLRASTWPGAPAGAARSEVEARAALLAALRGLLALELEPRDDLVERTARAVAEVRGAREQLEELLDGLSDLRPRPSPIPAQELIDAVEEVLEARAEVLAELWASDRAVAELDAEPPAVGDEEKKARALRQRDLMLEGARLGSRLSLHDDRLHDLRPWPELGRMRDSARSRLAGESWRAVFPRPYPIERADREESAEQRFKAGLEAIAVMKVQLGRGLRVVAVHGEKGPAAKAGVLAGAQVVGVRAAADRGTRAAPARLSELADALGRLATKEGRAARVAFGQDGAVVEAELTVRLPARR